MSKRNNRKNIATETLKIMEQGHFISGSNEKISIEEELNYAVKNTTIYTPESSNELINELNPISLGEPTQFEVTAETTLDATRRLINEGNNDVLCLNFASAKNPGGGFLGGSQAQEESIARASGLYNCLLKGEEYYKINRAIKTCFYTDYMIYSPEVPIFKDEEGNNLDKIYKASVITAPAVNKGVIRFKERSKLPEIELVMKRRIEKVLAIAYSHKNFNLVLGAWGCGVFQNDPAEIAMYFKEIIDSKFKNVFKKIVFAVYAKNERFINPFKSHFL
ncbi:MAG: TIGR02452 family protein [Flammeovirgaceae bacterium]|nr:TIGR02452 family protein [Flammeovirgaceae bacterium]